MSNIHNTRSPRVQRRYKRLKNYQPYDAPPIPLNPNPVLPTPEAEAEYYAWLEQRTWSRHPPVLTKQMLDKWHWKHATLIRRKYYLSPQAQTNLFKLACAKQYTRDVGKGRIKPLTKLIQAFANPDLQWKDNRSFNCDLECIKEGIPPLWLTQDDTYPCKQVAIHTSTIAEQTLYKLALSYGILPRYRYDIDNPGPIVSFLLEVIGQELLVPVNLPTNPNPTKRAYRRPFVNYVQYP